MFTEFKSFLTKSNALALAVGVIIGAAMGKVVSAVVADVLMPLIGMVLPGGDWRQAQIVLGKTMGPDGKEIVNAIKYGDLLGNLIDFLIIAWVIFIVIKGINRLKRAEEKPAPPPPATPEDVLLLREELDLNDTAQATVGLLGDHFGSGWLRELLAIDGAAMEAFCTTGLMALPW